MDRKNPYIRPSLWTGRPIRPLKKIRPKNPYNPSISVHPSMLRPLNVVADDGYVDDGYYDEVVQEGYTEEVEEEPVVDEPAPLN